MKRLFSCLLILAMLLCTVGAQEEESTLLSGEALSYEETWSITASGEAKWYPITNAFDGNVYTYWHSAYTSEGGKIIERDELPFTITVTFPTLKTLTGVRYIPRQIRGAETSSAGIWKAVEFYTSEDGETFVLAAKQAYPSSIVEERLPVDAALPKGSYKAIRMRIINAQSGYGSAGEIQFLTGEVTPTASDKREGCLSRDFWEVKASSVRTSYPADNILDGQEKTYWHTNYTNEGSKITGYDTAPFTLEFTLPIAKETSGLLLLPRQDGDSGRFIRFHVLAAKGDEDDYTMLVENASLELPHAEQEIPFYSNVTVKKVKLEILATSNNYGSLAEFYMLEKNDDYPSAAYEEVEGYRSRYQRYKLDRSSFTAESDTTTFQNNNSAFGPSKLFDDSFTSFWMTEAGSNIHLTIDMHKIYTIDEIDITPRQDRLDGCWLKFSIWASTDDVDWHSVMEDVTWERSSDRHTLHFEGGLTARYIEFEFQESGGRVASCADMQFYQTYEQKNADRQHFQLTIGEPLIRSYQGEERQISLDVAPYIVNGSTLVPLRGLLEEMGAKVTWEGDTQSIYVETDDLSLTLQIANKLVYVNHPRYGAIRYTLLNTPEIRDNRTFIPLRFVSEILGYDVEWTAKTQTIDIVK